MTYPMAVVRHKGKVDAVAFSPKGDYFATGSGDHHAQLWDAATGKAVGKPMPHPGPVLAVAFTPDGRMLVTAAEKGVWRWDTHSNRQHGQASWHEGLVKTMLLSPDGKAILSGSQDKTARLWDAATGQPSVGRSLTKGRSSPWRSAPMARWS